MDRGNRGSVWLLSVYVVVKWPVLLSTEPSYLVWNGTPRDSTGRCMHIRVFELPLVMRDHSGQTGMMVAVDEVVLLSRLHAHSSHVQTHPRRSAVIREALKRHVCRVLSTLNRELLKPSSSVALHRHSNSLVDILPPEADSSISLLQASEKPDVTYTVRPIPWILACDYSACSITTFFDLV